MSDSRGFSLLEALVAVAILGLSLPSITAMLSTAVAHERAAQQRSARLDLADRLLARATSHLPAELGAVTGAEGAMRWTVETWSDPAPPRESNAHLRPVHVRVTVNGATSNPPPLRLETMVLTRTGAGR